VRLQGDTAGFLARHLWLAYALLTLAMFIYGSYFVVGRAVYEQFPPVAFSFWRALLACALLLPFVWRATVKNWPLIRRQGPLIVAIGIAQAGLGQVMAFWSLHSTTAINASLISALQPALIVLLAAILVGERLDLRHKLGIVIALAGAVVAIARGDLAVLRDLSFVVGDLYMVVTGVCWALYTVLVKRVPAALDPVVLFFALTAAAAVVLAPFYALEAFVVESGIALNAQTIASLFYIVVFTGIFCLILLNAAIHAIGPGRVGAFYNLIPVATALIAVPAIDEPLRLYHVLGLALVISGIYLTSRPAAARI
jgi:drug/metabolite transporter (DMT)-like permease